MDDVMPFLNNVLRGKNVPEHRKLEVAEHYRGFNGYSPINQQNRDLMDALKVEFAEHGVDLPIYWGNRNWHPLLTDTVKQMKEDGVQNVIAFFTSAYSSYSGCRQYRENIAEAIELAGPGAPTIQKMRACFNHPGFVMANVDRVTEAMEQFAPEDRKEVEILFTAHSIPLTMAKKCAYQVQLKETSRLIAEFLNHPSWRLVYQSRSGPPHQPWLEPDICDELEKLKKEGKEKVLICPVGFVSDHVEVIYDLDTEAAEVCSELGMQMVRAATVGTHPRFVRMIREQVEARMGDSDFRPTLGDLPARPDVCPVDCCLPR